jgi:hypothetical protein
MPCLGDVAKMHDVEHKIVALWVALAFLPSNQGDRELFIL